MPAHDDSPGSDFREAIEELASALQVAVLLAAGLDRALCDSVWREDTAGLVGATRRAARAASELRRMAPMVRTRG
jgi:hypothetical protein